MTGLNIKDHWCSDGGAFWWHNNIAWGLQIAAIKMKRENNLLAWEKIRSSLENKSYLREGLNILKKYDPDSFVLEWLNNLNNDYTFEEIKPISTWLKKPMLIIGGLWDPHLQGAFDLYKKSKEAGGSPEMIIGNATHLNWWEGSQESLLKFFDKHLKSDENFTSKNSKGEKKIWNISLNKWEELDNKFDPEFIFGLKSDGTANVNVEDGSLTINSKGSGWFTIVNDPWRPTPSDGAHLGPNPGKFNRNIIDKRLDVGVFQTNFFEEDQHFKGVPKLEISVKSDQPNYDICAALSLVEDDEKVNQFSTGFLRVKKSKINVDSVHQITMQPTNISLIKGSKLRLSISGAAYPSIGVNPGFDDRYIGAPSINHRVITLSFVLNNSFMKMTPFL
jgi:hypothetical protein